MTDDERKVIVMQLATDAGLLALTGAMLNYIRDFGEEAGLDEDECELVVGGICTGIGFSAFASVVADDVTKAQQRDRMHQMLDDALAKAAELRQVQEKLQ